MNNNTQDQNEAVINSLLETIASRNKEISALEGQRVKDKSKTGELKSEIERLKELVYIKSDLAASYIEQTVVLEGEIGRLEGEIYSHLTK
jgi:hypothetical protein